MTQRALSFMTKRGMTIQEQFEDYHAAHPELYLELVRLALDVKGRGRKKYGLKAIAEVARWNLGYHKEDDEEYAINNNYVSRYARLIMENEPELKGFFELRKLKAA